MLSQDVRTFPERATGTVKFQSSTEATEVQAQLMQQHEQ